MSPLRVRAYNVLFGDALLVSIPERQGKREVMRHVLIDVGNVLSGPGGKTDVFAPVFADIQKQLRGKPLDLYVMTHEHMDHVKGLLHAATNLGIDLKANYAWLTASAEPTYYDTHEDAKKKRLELTTAFEAMARYFAAAPEAQTPWVWALLANNNPRDTGDCVKHLRKVAPAANTTYVYRGINLDGRHPFTEATVEIWAPEEDTSEYYGRFHPMFLGLAPDGNPRARPRLAQPLPPPGVDAGAFYNLVECRRRGWGANLLTIDQAANNTSVVFCLEWRGWRLLFPGDAEQRSWKTMAREKVLKPVHFLKIGHHGSSNGTPPVELLNEVLPLPASDRKKRQAVLCTCADCYSGVPHDDTLTELRRRCTVRSVQECDDDVCYLDFMFEGK